MPDGAFFHLESEQGKIFAYNRIFDAEREDFSPVYVHIQSYGLFFYFNNLHTSVPTVLIDLPFADYDSPAGKLSRNLNEILKVTTPIAREKLETVKQETDEDKKSDILSPKSNIRRLKATYYSNLDIWDSDQSRISLKTLFLDFLFDLKYSEVFQQSPHYDQLMTVIRENFLLKALRAKSEFYFHKQHSSKKDSDTSSETLSTNNCPQLLKDQSGIGWSYHFQQHLVAADTWASIIISETACELFASSDWFDKVETEMKAVRTGKIGTKKLPVQVYSGDDKYTWQPPEWLPGWVGNQLDSLASGFTRARKGIKPLIAGWFPQLPFSESVKERQTNAITDWYLQRFNFIRAFSINFQRWGLLTYGMLLIFPLLYLGGFSGFVDQIAIWGGLITLFVLVTFQIANDKFFSSLMSFSPRLILILLVSWLGFDVVNKEWSIYMDLYGLRYGFSMLVLCLYLVRELKVQAADLKWEMALSRSFGVMLLAGIYAVLIGMYAMNVTYKEKLSEEHVMEQLQQQLLERGYISDSIVVVAHVYQHMDAIKKLQVIHRMLQDQNTLPKPFPWAEWQELVAQLDSVALATKDMDLLQLQLDSLLEMQAYAASQLVQFPEDLRWVKMRSGDHWNVMCRFSPRLVIFPYHLVHYAMISLFLGLFINSIFRGQRVTGF